MSPSPVRSEVTDPGSPPPSVRILFETSGAVTDSESASYGRYAAPRRYDHWVSLSVAAWFSSFAASTRRYSVSSWRRSCPVMAAGSLEASSGAPQPHTQQARGGGG